ncbi:retrovirus-related Pol polyprotein from transposon opus [Trichonephila clavata]|uniref:Retrovirus-related Pol polyprotein from transposon opus n=1 Tax=Trichonephila clavata TaxID=2740835 RepID=A0A8X6F951_TRICU|nr:retrovirus-related Pol polyprotein from transposon opus [Trichonephila clavata]
MLFNSKSKCGAEVSCKWHMGTACADSGASHSIAGETLYLLLQKEGANFQKTQITMSLADGHKSEVEVYTTSVVIRLEERVIRTQLIILPYAKGNRTLLEWTFTESWHCFKPETSQLVL